jgi:crossover junction endodeoxyribonuclease RuvC
MMLLALDLGTHFGWAFTTDGVVIESGHERLGRGGRYEGGGMRYLRFERWLQALPQMPTEVYFEEVRRHRGTDAAHVYGGLLAVLTKWCEQHQIPYQGVPVGTIKKHATGSGAAGKDLMLAAAAQRGVRITDDNECDAWWLLDLKLAERVLM